MFLNVIFKPNMKLKEVATHITNNPKKFWLFKGFDTCDNKLVIPAATDIEEGISDKYLR